MAPRWALLAIAPLSLLACSFVLDFDELEDNGDVDRIGFGGTNADGAGGNESMGGSLGTGGGSAGEAGAAPATGASGGSGGGGSFEECGTDCDDGDPCTRDFCDTSQSPAECGHEPRQGVRDDGFGLSLTAETFHRVTMASGADEFYLSAFRSIEGENETTLYSIPRDDQEIVERFRASDLNQGSPASALGLVADSSDGFVLHGYIGFVDAVGGGNSRVNHLRFDDLAAPESTVVGWGYDTSVPSRYPKAMVLDQKVHGAWIDLGGSVAMQISTGALVTFNSNAGVPARAQTFALLGGPSAPGIVYANARGEVFAQLRGGDEVELEDCAGGSDGFDAMHSAQVGETRWLTSWTSQSQGSERTETKLVVCPDDNGCFAQACDGGSTVLPNVHHAADAALELGGSRVAVASAAPTVGNGGVTLELTVRLVDYGDPAVDVPSVDVLDELQVTSSDDPSQVPDWPALSFLPPNKLALAFIEPDPGLGVMALRVQRYDVCLPP